MIDLMTAKKLEALKEQAGVSTKAVVESKAVKGLSRKSAKSAFKISVNIYGYELDARDIGQQLSKVGAFLQHPFYLDEGVEYLNPQFFDPQDGSSWYGRDQIPSKGILGCGGRCLILSRQWVAKPRY
ncbi:hypothetical protein ACHAQC_009903 [Fusarium culmorum]